MPTYLFILLNIYIYTYIEIALLFYVLRYDIELYQRIEQLIGKKLPLFPVVEEDVMLLVERITEAQRFAKMVIFY